MSRKQLRRSSSFDALQLSVKPKPMIRSYSVKDLRKSGRSGISALKKFSGSFKSRSSQKSAALKPNAKFLGSVQVDQYCNDEHCINLLKELKVVNKNKRTSQKIKTYLELSSTGLIVISTETKENRRMIEQLRNLMAHSKQEESHLWLEQDAHEHKH